MNTNVTSNYLHVALYLIITTVALFQLRYMYRMPWSPIDEYQHMDYIDQMSEGRMPSISDPISDELFAEIVHHPERNLKKTPNTRHELGLTGYSYQAKHPPLYYGLLATPDFVLKKFSVPIFIRLQILRTVTFLLFIAGLLLMLPLGKKMRQPGCYIPHAYILIGIAWCLLTATHDRYGLGNNYLSPLLINACLIALLNYWQSPGFRQLFLLSLLSGLSICGALTNSFVLPIIALIALPTFIRTFQFKTIFALLSGLILPAAILLLWKLNTIPDPAIGHYINDMLRMFFKANMVGYGTAINLFVNDLTIIDFIGSKLNLSTIHLTLAGLNFMLLLIFFITRKNKSTLWIFSSYLAFIYLIVLIGFLNRFVDEVTWVAFRHYMGFYPFLFLGISAGFLLLVKWVEDKRKSFA